MTRLENAGNIVLHGCPWEYQVLIFAGNKRWVNHVKVARVFLEVRNVRWNIYTKNVIRKYKNLNFHKKLWNKLGNIKNSWKYENWKFDHWKKLKFILDVSNSYILCKKNIYTFDQVSGYILYCNVYKDFQDQYRFPAGFKLHFEFSQNFLAYVTVKRVSSPALLEHKLPLRLLKHSTPHISKILPPSHELNHRQTVRFHQRIPSIMMTKSQLRFLYYTILFLFSNFISSLTFDSLLT